MLRCRNQHRIFSSNLIQNQTLKNKIKRNNNNRVFMSSETHKQSDQSSNTLRTRQAKVLSIDQCSPTVKQMKLKLWRGLYQDMATSNNSTEKNSPFPFLPGQWIEVLHPYNNYNPVGFSMTNPPSGVDGDPSTITLAVKQTKEPLTSYIHEQMPLGEILNIRGPGGDVCYNPKELSHFKQIFCVAGGIGITPLMSILRFLDQNPDLHEKVTLLYSAKTKEELLFYDELQNMAENNPERYHFEFSVTGDTPSNRLILQGRFDREVVTEYVLKHEQENLKNTLFYLCGPPPMLQTLPDHIKHLGVPEENIMYEKWFE
eukprot:gb/GECH01012449.1/.p1 GENE.gb/GECH01012449.1/~~gb/GECH01012449.1/.p1  ORF type:complete len:315 (+),score=77.20 gb/GECH01012449.1/:1-945(+)